MIILWILLWILAGVLGLALLLLVVPMGVEARGSAVDLELDGTYRAWWGFGLMSIRGGRGEAPALRIAGLRVKTLARKEREDVDEAEEKKPRRGPGLSWLLRHRRTLLRVAWRLLGTIGLRGRIEGSLGASDPAETAWLFTGLDVLRGRIGPLELELIPRYTDSGWALEGWLQVRVWPLRTALGALGMLFRRDVKAMLKTARG